MGEVNHCKIDTFDLLLLLHSVVNNAFRINIYKLFRNFIVYQDQIFKVGHGGYVL